MPPESAKQFSRSETFHNLYLRVNSRIDHFYASGEDHTNDRRNSSMLRR